MATAPNPHPLDYDWRFTLKSNKLLTDILPNKEPLLAVGTPSLARFLQTKKRPVTLVDRQPIQGVRDHLVTKIGNTIPTGICLKVAVADPPWYPDDVANWVKWTAAIVGKGGTVFVTVWPEGTRPNAEIEKQSLRYDFKSWSKVEELGCELSYEVPQFEASAGQVGFSDMSRSPRIGQLWKITVHEIPTITSQSDTNGWYRLVLNDYQLAITTGSGHGTAVFNNVAGAIGRFWPFVSRRAMNRELIDVWSSDNEVASLGRPQDLIAALRIAVRNQNAQRFEDDLGEFPGLLKWNLPRPPYWRIHEWQQ